MGSEMCIRDSRCGCTDDTPCRLGDAGSMTFFPWFVPLTGPPAQLREVGPDRGLILTESCSDVHLHVCRCRTGDEDYCCCCSVGSRRQNITACSGGIFARQRVLQQRVLQLHRRVLQQHVLLLLLLLLLLRALQQHEEVVVHRKPSDRVVGGSELCEWWVLVMCVSWAESSCPTADWEKKKRKTNN